MKEEAKVFLAILLFMAVCVMAACSVETKLGLHSKKKEKDKSDRPPPARVILDNDYGLQINRYKVSMFTVDEYGDRCYFVTHLEGVAMRCKFGDKK